MANDRIDSIIIKDAIQKEIDFLDKTLTDLAGKLKGFGAVTVKMEGSKSVKDYSLAQAKLAEEMKAVEALAKQRFATDAKIITLQTDYARATAANTVQLAKQNAELKTQAQLQAANTGSIERARAAVKALTTERNQLNLFTKEGQDRQAQLNAQIDKYNNFIKKNVDQLAQQKINVGNYSGAIVVLKTALDDVSKKIDANTKAGQGNSAANGKLIKEQTILTSLVNAQSSGFARGAMEIRANEKALLQLEQAGLAGSRAYKELALATGKLKDSLADVASRTKALGSDTFVLDSMIQGAQTLAGAYGVAQGAAALFGDENEELQKTFVKLQAIMTVIQGLQAVATGLQKESAFVLGIMQVKEKALLAIQTLRNFVLRGTTTATVANTTATTAQGGAIIATTVATRAATAAATALRFALIATGIGAILVLLASAASAMNVFGDKTEEATESLDGFNDRLAFSQELLQGQIDSIRFNSKVQEELIKQRGGTESDVSKNTIEGYKNEEKVYREAAQSKQKELDKLLQSTKNYNSEAAKKLIEGIDADKKAANDVNKNIVLDGLKERTRVSIEERKKKEEDDKKYADTRKSAAKKASDERKKNQEEAAKRAEEYAKRELAAEIEIMRSGFEQQKKISKEASDNEKLSQEERLENLSKFAKASQALIEFEKNTVTKDKEKTPKEKALAEQKAAFDSAELQKEFSNSLTAIITQNFDKQTEASKEANEEMTRQVEAFYQKQLDLIDTDVYIQLLKANEDYQSGRIKNEEDFQKAKDKIEKEGLQKSLGIQIARLAGEKALLQIRKQDTTAVEKELARLSLEFSETTIEKKKLDIDTLFEYSKQGVDLLKSIFSGITDKEKDAVKEQIELADKKAQREIAAINASGLAEADKKKRIAAIEKQHAFDKERLEKRQRQLDLERARFEKQLAVLQLIAQIAIDLAKGRFELAAVGGAALIKLIATPLPKFEKGTKSAPKGLAIVSEKGSELVIPKSGHAYLTPPQPSLISLVGEEMILPHDISKGLLTQMNLLHILQKAQSSKGKITTIENPFGERAVRALERMEGKPPIMIINNPGIESTAYYLNNIKY